MWYLLLLLTTTTWRVGCHLGHEVEGVHPPVADVDALELHGRRAAASGDLDDHVGVALLVRVRVRVGIRVRVRVRVSGQG